MRIAHLDGDPYCSLTIPTREPLCAVCDEPIHWCLDMFSFTMGADRRLAHARCVWHKAAFEREAKKSRTLRDLLTSYPTDNDPED